MKRLKENGYGPCAAQKRLQPRLIIPLQSLGTAYENCTVEYVGIDDDVNGIRNGFFLGGNLVELIQEGMVFQGRLYCSHYISRPSPGRRGKYSLLVYTM